MSADNNGPNEKTRTCPSCRTPISVLATKCKFCGEVVGKPKEETRNLSINDLGGENVQHRAISSSVMDALESFRIEDSKDGSDIGGFSGMDDIDVGGDGEDGQKDYNRSPLQPASTAAATASGGIRIGPILKIVAVLAVVAVIAVKAPSFLKSALDNDATAKVPTFTNEAPSILETTGDPLQALEAAASASTSNPSAENTKIADEMAEAVAEKIRELISANPWDKRNLSEARRMATRAASVSTHSIVTAVRQEVVQENKDYSLVLTKIQSNRAEFTLGDKSVVFAKEGEPVGDRFSVVKISGDFSVKLEDTKRDGRTFTLEVGMPLR